MSVCQDVDGNVHERRCYETVISRWSPVTCSQQWQCPPSQQQKKPPVLSSRLCKALAASAAIIRTATRWYCFSYLLRRAWVRRAVAVRVAQVSHADRRAHVVMLHAARLQSCTLFVCLFVRSSGAGCALSASPVSQAVSPAARVYAVRKLPGVQLVRVGILFRLHTRASVGAWRTTAVVAATTHRNGSFINVFKACLLKLWSRNIEIGTLGAVCRA